MTPAGGKPRHLPLTKGDPEPMIRLTKKDSQLFHQLSYVVKARATGSRAKDRPVNALIMISQGSAVATDGHRLHRATSGPIECIPEGLYTIIRSSKEEMLLELSTMELSDYPDTVRIAPREPEAQPLPQGLDSQAATIIRATDPGLCYHMSYLLDALDQPDGFPYFAPGTPGKPLVLHGADYYALVMPRKL